MAVNYPYLSPGELAALPGLTDMVHKAGRHGRNLPGGQMLPLGSNWRAALRAQLLEQMPADEASAARLGAAVQVAVQRVSPSIPNPNVVSDFVRAVVWLRCGGPWRPVAAFDDPHLAQGYIEDACWHSARGRGEPTWRFYPPRMPPRYG